MRTNQGRETLRVVGPLLSIMVMMGCAGGGDMAAPTLVEEFGGEDAARSATANAAATEQERTVEESDIYRIEGDYLYVQNSATGLNVIDISDPADPVAVAQADVRGNAGELYVRDDRVFVLFEEIGSTCVVPDWMDVGTYGGRSELAILEGAPENPRLVARYCLPGTIVASRLVGDILYLANRQYAPDTWASSGQGRSWLLSFDVSDPENVSLADQIVMDGLSQEIHATNEVIYLAQRTENDEQYGNLGTIVRYIDISDPDGAMVERGRVTVGGTPVGRFHMDAWEDTFRIVTEAAEGWSNGANLYVIDVRDPDNLTVLGSLTHIGEGEELHATHFVGDRVYIVTYENVVRFYDPLWIVTVEDPTEPRILSELQVPGWSDYIFPMGDRLVAVGRGDRGDRVAVSLYDISNPFEPRELARDEFAGDEAQSEANIDFRGVTIVGQGVLGDDAMLVVPYTEPYVSLHGCEDPGQFLQLWDLRYDTLVRRGASEQVGTIRRSVVVDDYLYSISDEQVGVVDVTDRDKPITVAAVPVGDGSQITTCTAFEDLGCSVAAGQPRPGDLIVSLLGLLGLALLARSARRR